jgi:hypothetical protein
MRKRKRAKGRHFVALELPAVFIQELIEGQLYAGCDLLVHPKSSRADWYRAPLEAMAAGDG